MKSFVIENTWLDSKVIKHGWGNGYVIIPAGHPLHGKDYNDIDVEVNGGITFLSKVEDLPKIMKQFISDEDAGGWVVGFDTVHSWNSLSDFPKSEVERETEELKEQLESYSILTQTPV